MNWIRFIGNVSTAWLIYYLVGGKIFLALILMETVHNMEYHLIEKT